MKAKLILITMRKIWQQPVAYQLSIGTKVSELGWPWAA